MSKSQAILGGFIPVLVVLDSIIKQSEQARGSKPGGSIPPLPLHHLLPLRSCPVSVPVDSLHDEQQCWSVTQIKPSPTPQTCILVMVFRSATETLTNTVVICWLISTFHFHLETDSFWHSVSGLGWLTVGHMDLLMLSPKSWDYKSAFPHLWYVGSMDSIRFSCL